MTSPTPRRQTRTLPPPRRVDDAGFPVSAFDASAGRLLALATFTLLLGIACISDLRSRRIPNAIVLALTLSGIGYSLATMAPLAALAYALGGLAVGFAVWVPFWLGRVLGAGDVKLAAAAGAWLGVRGVLEASLLAAVVGGALALWALSRRGGLATGATRFGAWVMASRVSGRIAPELTPRERRIPYGVAIAAGAAVASWFPGLIL
jgi:prepilin peptidase CpaA